MFSPEGFILGLSTGAVCLAYCGPVLVPYLLGEGRNVRGNSIAVLLFLTGRLIAYLLVGIFAGIIGSVVLQPSLHKTVFFGVVYCILALILIAYGFYRFGEICLGRRQEKFTKRYGNRMPWILPAFGGLITGLNLCPPFLLAITGAMEGGSIGDSLIFFALFFLGTSVYFLPLPFLGLFRRQQVLRTIGKFAAIVAGVFYLYKGSLMLLIN
jgi:sulfite exporter TauE/SafE